MNGFDSHLNPLNNDNDFETESSSSFFYDTLFLVTALILATYAIAKFAESNNRLNFESRTARIISGLLFFMTLMLHTRSGDLELTDTENTIITVGPHRTGWEGVVVATKMTGTPPRFLATEAYNFIPGVSSFMNMVKAILVKEKPTQKAKTTESDKSQFAKTENDNTQPAFPESLVLASKALNEKGCVALFPQGNFARLGQEPPRVYTGAARLALKNNVPILVIRLDGFWCLQNPFIPMFIRNNAYYRAFFSALHMNNIQATLCCKIDFHLRPENKNLCEEEKIDEICAQLYAYYRHTKELTPKQIDTIKLEISNKDHLLIWNNKLQQDVEGKKLLKLKQEGAELEKNSEEKNLISMRNS